MPDDLVDGACSTRWQREKPAEYGKRAEDAQSGHEPKQRWEGFDIRIWRCSESLGLTLCTAMSARPEPGPTVYADFTN